MLTVVIIHCTREMKRIPRKDVLFKSQKSFFIGSLYKAEQKTCFPGMIGSFRLSGVIPSEAEGSVLKQTPEIK